MKHVSFRVRYPHGDAHPLHAAVMDSDTVSRADVLMWGPVGSVTSLLWLDADPETTRPLLGAIESLDRQHVAAGAGGTYAFVDQGRYEFDDDVMALVAGADVVFVPPLRFLASGEVAFAAVGDRDAVAGFYDRLEGDLDATIDAVREYRGPAASAVCSPRQREALAAARDCGYYAVPRTGSVDDVAAELEIARSTAGELLRKAEAAVVAASLDRDEGVTPTSVTGE